MAASRPGFVPGRSKSKGAEMGTPNREPQEYSRNIKSQHKYSVRYISYHILEVPYLRFPFQSFHKGLQDPSKGLWVHILYWESNGMSVEIYHIGIIVGYGIWPPFRGSYGCLGVPTIRALPF